MCTRCLAVLFISTGLVGCVTDDGYGWTHPKATVADFSQDSDECRRKATVRSPKTSSGSVGYQADVRRDYDDCMKARGWSWEKSAGRPDSGQDAVDCKLPSSEQIQRTTLRDCRNRFGLVLDIDRSTQSPIRVAPK